MRLASRSPSREGCNFGIQPNFHFLIRLHFDFGIQPNFHFLIRPRFDFGIQPNFHFLIRLRFDFGFGWGFDCGSSTGVARRSATVIA
jgi:hypothetical protein